MVCELRALGFVASGFRASGCRIRVLWLRGFGV